MFRALVLEATPTGCRARVRRLSRRKDLPRGEVLLEVEACGFNYKDAMAVCARGNLVRRYPHVPGVDFVGRVRESRAGTLAEGTRVIMTGFRVGEWYWGGFSELASIPKAEFLVPCPEELSPQAAMACGTAALSAMLAIRRLEQGGLRRDQGEVLVTGASGGVGSFGVLFLARAGYRVVASTAGENADYLRRLGAGRILDRTEFDSPLDPQKPLEPQRWEGVLDTVGGAPLARLLAQTKRGGSIAAIGLAAGRELEGTLLPFLLRGVSLLGVESAMTDLETRSSLWRKIAQTFTESDFAEIAHIHALEEIPSLAEKILKGQIRGRAVIDPRR